MTYDVIGITDTAGNMEVLVRHCQKNVEEHAWFTDHVFHLNATLSFDLTSAH